MTEKYGTSDLYLLASRNNKQQANFVSWLSKLSAWAANPFSFVWKQRNFYIFLHFTVVVKVLTKIIREKTKTILIYRTGYHSVCAPNQKY